MYPYTRLHVPRRYDTSTRYNVCMIHVVKRYMMGLGQVWQIIQVGVLLFLTGAESAVAEIIPNALSHFGYHFDTGAPLDLNDNGGMMGGGDPTTLPGFYGGTLLTDGPDGRGLDFNSNLDFTSSGAVGRDRNYGNLWLGTFHAPVPGSYGFRIAGFNDSAGIWLDLDQDAVIESNMEVMIQVSAACR